MVERGPAATTLGQSARHKADLCKGHCWHQKRENAKHKQRKHARQQRYADIVQGNAHAQAEAWRGRRANVRKIGIEKAHAVGAADITAAEQATQRGDQGHGDWQAVVAQQGGQLAAVKARRRKAALCVLVGWHAGTPVFAEKGHKRAANLPNIKLLVLARKDFFAIERAHAGADQCDCNH